MRAVLSVLGNDRKGIIAKVSNLLEQFGANIEDISQTILQDYFTMIMIVDMTDCPLPLVELQEKFKTLGKEINVDIRLQHEGIFNAMHKI